MPLVTANSGENNNNNCMYVIIIIIMINDSDMLAGINWVVENHDETCGDKSVIKYVQCLN